MSVSTRTQTRTGGSNKFKTISTEAHSGRLKIPRPGRMFSVDETRSPIRVTFHAAYQEHLEQMILRSKNDAAEACIEGVGFMTIGSVLMQSGLVHPARGGGLWLRDNYGRECLAKKRGVCVKRKVTQHNFAPFGGDTMEATPASLATFFALLAQRRLVSPSSSADMLALLDDGQTADDTRSPLTETLDRSVPTKVYSKLGLVDDFSDAVLVEREVGGKKLCFAAAAQELSLPTINALGVELEKIIRENNDV